MAPPTPKKVVAEGLPNAVRLTWKTPLNDHTQGLFINSDHSGTFTLQFTTPTGTRQDGTAFTTAVGTVQTTSAIPYTYPVGMALEDVQAALEALSNIDPMVDGVGGDVLVTGLGDVLSIHFRGQYAGVVVSPLVLNSAGMGAAGGTIAVTHRASLHDTAATSTPTASPTWTPAANSLLLAFIHTSNETAPTGVTGHGQTYTLIATVGVDSPSTSYFALWAAKAGASPTSANVVATYGSNRTGAQISEEEVTGHDNSLTLGVGAGLLFPQAPVVGDSAANAASGSVTLAAASGAGNRPISAFAHQIAELKTPRASWTELDDGSHVTPNRGLETQWRSDAFETTASATWATSADWAGIAAEIATTVGVAPTQAEIQGGTIVGQKHDQVNQFQVQVWTGAAGTGTLEEDRMVTLAEEFIHPASALRYMRVRSVANATTTSAWVESSATPEAALTSDGSAPPVVAAPTVTGGVGFLVARWLPVLNSSTVTYDVHVSATTGFTPSAGTKVGQVDGTLFFIRQLTDGSPLVYGTTYYVKIVASDADAAAAASAQGSGVMTAATSADISVNAITAAQILAGSVTAEKLEAVLVLASRVIAGDPVGFRSEMNHPDYPFLYWDGITPRFYVDETGGVKAPSLLFGTDASLNANNSIDLPEATPYATPVLVGGTTASVTSTTATTSAWSPATTAGNLLYVTVISYDDTAVTTPPSGYTFRHGSGGLAGRPRIYTYTKTAAGGDAAPSVTMAASGELLISAQEWSGIDTTNPIVNNSGRTGASSVQPQTQEMITANPPSSGVLIADYASRGGSITPDVNWEWSGNLETTLGGQMASKILAVPNPNVPIQFTSTATAGTYASSITYLRALAGSLSNPPANKLRLHAEDRAGIEQLAYRSAGGTTRYLSAGRTHSYSTDLVTVENTTTETEHTLISFAGGDWTAGQVVDILAYGYTDSIAAPGNLTFGMELNGTNVNTYSDVIAAPTSARSDKPWFVKMKLVCVGVGAGTSYDMVYELFTDFTTTLAEKYTVHTGGFGFTSTDPYTIGLNIDWATANVGNSFKREGYSVTLHR